MEIRFKYLTYNKIKEYKININLSCSWKNLLKSLKEVINDISPSPYLFLIDNEGIICSKNIEDSYTFWNLYNTIYLNDNESIFVISNVKIVKIRFFLHFDININCAVDILANTPWIKITEILAEKFDVILSHSVKKIGLMESSEDIYCHDTESFWSMLWKHWTEEKKINMQVFASRCYSIKCQWVNFPTIQGIAKIAEDSTTAELDNALLTALRLVSTEKLIKIEVVDGEGDPIGMECTSTEILLRRYKKHIKTDPNVKVLVTTKTIQHQFSNPTFDSRTLEVSSTNTDYLGIYLSIDLYYYYYY